MIGTSFVAVMLMCLMTVVSPLQAQSPGSLKTEPASAFSWQQYAIGSLPPEVQGDQVSYLTFWVPDAIGEEDLRAVVSDRLASGDLQLVGSELDLKSEERISPRQIRYRLDVENLRSTRLQMRYDGGLRTLELAIMQGYNHVVSLRGVPAGSPIAALRHRGATRPMEQMAVSEAQPVRPEVSLVTLPPPVVEEEPTFWRRYRYWIIGGAAVVTTSAILLLSGEDDPYLPPPPGRPL